MKLVCEKYQKKVARDNACCEHPGEYCRFRDSCMINFIERENRRRERGLPGQGMEKREMEELDFEKSGGLIPAIAQDYESGEVLMLAYINRESWDATIATGKAHYWSRSRSKLWLKGESSGHIQEVCEILVDCDRDTVVFKVRQLGGAACHTGHRSCFYRRHQDGAFKVISEPVFDPKEVYGK